MRHANERQPRPFGISCVVCREEIDPKESAEPYEDGWLHTRCLMLLLFGFRTIQG